MLKFNPQPKPEKTPKKEKKPLKRTPLKRSQKPLKRTPLKKVALVKKAKSPSGEYELFLKIYAEQKGKCEITGKQIPFDVWSFMHVLSKKAYPSFRLKRENIMMVDRKIHELYDNSSQEKLLEAFPQAIVVYERKQQLKQEYYNVKPI